MTAPSGFACVMAHFDLGPYSESRGRLAISLADRFGAHFIGVAAEETVLPIYSDMATNIGDRIGDKETARVTCDLDAAKAIFDRATGARRDVDWRAAIAEPDRFVIGQARAADLVVIGRRASYDQPDGRMALRPGLVAMECGRPVLVVPPEREHLAAKKVVVAWKDTREARRAAHDALPILRRAEEVVVLSASPQMRDESAEDVAAWLTRHGAPARPEVRSDEMGSIADEIIEAAADIGADLIVSGAYGHSRTREWFFGGATRELLERAEVCLFMSH